MLLASWCCIGCADADVLARRFPRIHRYHVLFVIWRLNARTVFFVGLLALALLLLPVRSTTGSRAASGMG